MEDIEAALGRIVSDLGVEQPNVGQTPDGMVKHFTFEDAFGNWIGLFEDLQISNHD